MSVRKSDTRLRPKATSTEESHPARPFPRSIQCQRLCCRSVGRSTGQGQSSELGPDLPGTFWETRVPGPTSRVIYPCRLSTRVSGVSRRHGGGPRRKSGGSLGPVTQVGTRRDEDRDDEECSGRPGVTGHVLHCRGRGHFGPHPRGRPPDLVSRVGHRVHHPSLPGNDG